MKKLLPVLLILLAAMGTLQAQNERIVSITPDSTSVTLPPSGLEEITITVRGAHFVSQRPPTVLFNVPICHNLNYPIMAQLSSPPFDRTQYFHTDQVINDSTITVYRSNDIMGLQTSWLDIGVVLYDGRIIKKDHAFKVLGSVPSPGFRVTPAMGNHGQTLDVLVSGARHIPGQVSSTFIVDFGQDYYMQVPVTLSTELVQGGNTRATIIVPPGTAEGCYDAILYERAAQSGECAVINNSICVSMDTVANPGMIRGNVYLDAGRNCVNDPGTDQALNRILVRAEPGPYFAVTDEGGNYTMRLPFGTYTVSQSSTQFYLPICGPTYTVQVSATQSPVCNFADSARSRSDLGVSIHTWRMRPGRTSSTLVWVTNAGNTPMSGKVYVVIDTNLHYVNADPAPLYHQGDTTVFSFTNILPNAPSSAFTIIDSLRPDFTLMGRVVNSKAWISTPVQEVYYGDDTTYEHQEITNSWDPNDKSVSREGDLSPKDSVLTYRIRFQNSGTDTAFTVIVRDTLSQFVDVGSIKVLGASHRNTFSLIGLNEAEWRFSNILLPDSNVDRDGSQGFISYSVQRKKGLAPGTHIDNRAGIYFDFNPPVMTNTVTSIVAIPTNIKGDMVKGDGISIYPNPLQRNQSVVRFSTKTDLSGASFVLRDVLGNVVNSAQAIKSGSATLDQSCLTKGLYFYQVRRGGKTLTAGKLAVE